MSSVINKISIVPLVILLASCAFSQEVKLSPGAENVRVTKSDPTDNYKPIGTITGVDGGGCGYYGYFGTYDKAVKDLQNKASKMGGTYARIMTIQDSYKSMSCKTNIYTINATIYKKETYLPTPTPIIQIKNNLSSKIRQLNDLYEQKLITKNEYETKRQKLLNEEF